MRRLFATTERGFEELLKVELEKIGATNCQVTQGGIRFEADDYTLYKTLLWSRLSSRILLPIANTKIYSDVDLYVIVLAQNWQNYFGNTTSFFVDFNGINSEIRHSQFGAMRVKDAIVDYFENNGDMRPKVDKEQPDIRIHAYLNRKNLILSLDLSGSALHMRGYRQQAGKAPLRETLAAMIIVRSGWQSEMPLIDPMCGSGTLLIEAAQIKANIAPQLYRTEWGFKAWKGHNVLVWQQVKNEALLLAAETKQNSDPQVSIYGFDVDRRVLEKARNNALKAGVQHLITWQQGDIADLANPFIFLKKEMDLKKKTDLNLNEIDLNNNNLSYNGVVVCNPPYGERLGSTPALIALYTLLGQRLKAYFQNWNVSIFTANAELLNCMNLRAYRQFKAKNGPLDCVQKNYHITKKPENSELGTSHADNLMQSNITALDFINRLKKNIKKIEKWAKQHHLDAYRLYDADLPEYNFALDRYGDYIVIQEYAPPKTIDEGKAKSRLVDAVAASISVIGIETDKVILKTREKQKGKQQYQKLADQKNYFYINEFGAKLWVNLTDYLDTGLFLDHRLTRKMLGEMCKGKDFLNLFAYTGSATVHAALAGVKTTTTVDMSSTYLNWAEQNFILNHINTVQHKLIQADCLEWLTECEDKFDVIFIDPPTFSNSKRMLSTWDVQRDHIELMVSLKRILRLDGTIIFSNNKRGFKFDFAALDKIGLQASNISAETLPLDFERNPHIHNCWVVKNAE